MVTTSDETQRTLRLFEQAAAANQVVPSRSGSVIVLSTESADEVVVTADLHGNRINFDRIVETADLERHPARHLVMQEVCHGGPSYPASDGCMSHLLLEDVARLKIEYPERFHFLLSNHEWAEIVDFPITKSNKLLNLSFRSGLQLMYGDESDHVHKGLTQFLKACPLALRVDRTLICHSAPDRVRQSGFDVELFERDLTDEDFAPHGDLFRLLWGRDFSHENAAAFAQLVDADVLIHGHEPCCDGFWVPNQHQLILDCCGPRACYVTLPTCQPLSHAEIVERVDFLV